MSAQSPGSYLLSATLHGLAAALVALLFYTANQNSQQRPKIFELVAGAGDNYAATEAPALGVPGGIKAVIPPAPAAPPPAKAEVAPIQPAPEPAAKTADQQVPNFKKTVQRTASRKAARLEAQYEKQLEAEERRRLSYEQFQKEHAAKGAGTPSSSKAAKIDAEGIREGVIGGSTANKKGGAGGKALTRDEGDLLDAYFALLKARARENFVALPDVSDKLAARVVFYVAANGTISHIHLASSSGNAAFDQAVIDAFERTHSIGPRPDGRGDESQLTFSMIEEESP